MTLSPDQFAGGEQLRMFMSAREIVDRYEPLRGDRKTLTRSTYPYSDPDPDEKPLDTTPPKNPMWNPEPMDNYWSANYRSITWGESTDHLWERKAREGFTSKKRAKLAADVRSGAAIKHPLWLGPPDEPGVEGAPQVYGGHHRLAMMLQERPDDLMPVLHTTVDQAMNARWNGRASFPWKYT